MDQARLPSITVLLSLIGAVLMIPLGIVTASTWQQAEHRVTAAVEVSDRTDRLDSLILLLPALDKEMRSTTWSVGSQEILQQLPPDVSDFLGTDNGSSLDDNRAAVDQLVIELNAVGVAEQITALRAEADRGEFGPYDSSRRFGQLLDLVDSDIEGELALLNEATIRAGGDSIAQAARAAEASAALQVALSGQYDVWALLQFSELLEPTSDDVRGFAESVGVLRDRASDMDRSVPPGTESALRWDSLRQSADFTSMLSRYDSTIENFVQGSQLTTEADNRSEAPLNDVLVIAAQLNTAGESADLLGNGVWAVVDQTLTELSAASEAAIAEAEGDRNRTVFWLALAAFTVVSGVLALVTLIGRPVEAMADAAEQLSVGQLEIHLDERGPREVRNSARALNQALESLRNTEAQAVALAEERLDDPVLQQRVVGGIGESLQAAVARLASSLTERETFQQRLAHEAAHDGLTKLSNRNAILRHLDAALARTRRTSSSLAILFLDLDDFKVINDAHGHQAGDAVLRKLAQRLVAASRQGDLAGRMGGDEFVVVAEAVESIDEALELARRVMVEVTEPITFDGGIFEPSVSIGVAMADVELTADELLRDADLAVYRAKSLGKGRIEVCDEDLRGEVRERESIERALDDAIELGQFVLHFQPSVNATNHTITSFEALIRWNHPTRGVVGPNDFIPIAERSSLIARIDRWVLSEAAAQLKAWTGHPTLGDKPVAVNISGRHLGSGSLTNDVLDALSRHDVHPSRLLLEVTETALLADLVTAAHELSILREHGVRVALDDFGTGYMSLSHLRSLPVDVLKIDQTFIAEMVSDSDHPLIRLIVDTGHLLGVDVTAEGVETSAQASMLTEMGVDSLQGYLFGHPVDSAEVEPESQRPSAA